MARVFIMGSSQGLGLMAGRHLIEHGHSVVLHARTEERARNVRRSLPTAEAILIGDLSTLATMRSVAKQVNALGRFDAVIHNVGVGYQEPRRIETSDGLSQLWAVNVLAPYVLTALIRRPGRLVYLSSGLHPSGEANLDDVQWDRRRWDGTQAYSDTKLQDVWLAFAVARHWPHTRSNALEPGWVATRMGGDGAPDDLSKAHLTQAWLATSNDDDATVTGGYFYHQQRAQLHTAARQHKLQDRLLDYCRAISNVSLKS